MRNIILLYLFIFPLTVFSQDVHFSQINRSPVNMNPALAGTSDNKYRFFINDKGQWNAIGNSFHTTAASAEMNFFGNSWQNGMLGAGISFYSDKAGDAHMGITRAAFSLAYKSIIDRKNSISAGIQAGYMQRSFNASRLKWENQYNGDSYDPNLPSKEPTGTSVSGADFGCGIDYMFKPKRNISGNVGLSGFHLSNPDYSFYGTSNEKLYMKFVLHGEGLIVLKNTPYSICPEFMAALQDKQKEIVIGSILRFGFIDPSQYTGFIKEINFIAGLDYRVGDALICAVGVERHFYSLRLSYDVTLSGLHHANSFQGGYELSLRIINPKAFYYSKKRF